MTISVVQATVLPSAFSGSFASNVTAGNTVYLVIAAFSSSNVVISSSNPVFAGSPVTGAVKLAEAQSPYSSFTVYTATWMLPDVSGGSASVGVTVTNGTANSATGLLIYEAAGLGATPAEDQSSTGAGNSANISSGASGAITQAPEFILGAFVSLNGPGTVPGSPWTSQAISGGNEAAAGYQVATSPGGTYTYSATQSSAVWAASVVTVYPAASSVTGSFSAAMAGMGLAFTGSETVSGQFGMKMAPMGQAFTGHETGVNVTGSFGVAMAPMGLRFSQRTPGGLVVPADDEARAFKRELLWGA